ncbi:MAG: hypothetical protein ABIN99_10760 [Nitrosospira sp.]
MLLTPHVRASMPAHDGAIPPAVSSLFCNTANHLYFLSIRIPSASILSVFRLTELSTLPPMTRIALSDFETTISAWDLWFANCVSKLMPGSRA